MNSYTIVFTIKNGMHPFKQTVKADNIDAAQEQVKSLVKQHGHTLKQIVSIVQN